jgi:hypothetical protein
VSASDPHEQAKLFVLQLLTPGVVTSDEIRAALEAVLAMLGPLHPDVEFDLARLERDLEAVLNIFQPEGLSLEDMSGHLDWLPTRREDIEWRFWDRYLRFVREQESLPPLVLERLETTTTQILRKLEDPRRPGTWDRRGMVVGQIQSGKTGNYTGLVCRAADAGYRFIVVLAGIHNSLRSQTQLRLDTGFLGFDTQRRQLTESDDDIGFTAAALGVGRLLGVPRLDVASLTSSHESGDFGIKKANSLGILVGNYPVLLVVKKHRKILDNLREWVLATLGTGEPKIVRDLGLLVIDDEADNASVNTVDPRDVLGEFADIDPSKVNGAIRSFLNVFEKRAYVGYTATPYANIYIEPDVNHPEFGKDLFPSSFIEYLRPPSNYFGPARLFGEGDSEPLPLNRSVGDHATWVPDRHKSDLRVGPLPESVQTAIRSFLLARAARLARGQLKRHNSMLIHVTRYTAVQQQVREQVEQELSRLRARIRFGDGAGRSIRDELRDLWENDFSLTSTAFDPVTCPPLDWASVAAKLDDAVEPVVVKTINGTAQDALEYFEHRATGLNVIAIGGDKLSRGLTLEGLTVSYYLRTSRAYDTLLQMGRWFGYRDGYEDLCRLWTTPTLWQAYRGISDANEELNREFEEMAARGATPRDYGLKVRGSIAGMLVTAPNKMRAAQKLRIGFSGSISETVVLHCDRVVGGQNLALTDAFLTRVGDAVGHDISRSGNLVWSGVPGADVAEHFFTGFRTPTAAWRVHAPTIASYINNRVAAGELVNWTVVLVSVTGAPNGSGRLGGHQVGLTKRSVLTGLQDRVREGLYSIRRILNPPDEWSDFSDLEVTEALEETRRAWQKDQGNRRSEPDRPSGVVIRRARPPTSGLLVIYPLEPPSAELAAGADLHDGAMVGFAVSFPHSPAAPTVDYVVNRQFLDELFAEPDE